MNLKCVMGMHEWSRCKCSTCGKIRDEGHDWVRDCEKCATCGSVRASAHSWDGCKCSTCGKNRDEGHDWVRDCEQCAKCGNVRRSAHSWNGCKCATCGNVRASAHSWNGCKCSTCGETRNDDHSWNGCECSTCGKTRDEGHDWGQDRLKCARCGSVPSIHDAASSGNLDLVTRLLELDPALSQAVRYGSTPLHGAAENGFIPIAEALLANGADIHRKDSSQKTPLHSAAGSDRIDMVDFLIGRGADVNAGYPHSKTPLHSAASIVGGPEMVKKLLSHGAIIDAQDDLKYTPLHWAVESLRSTIVRVLCEHGADKSKRTFQGGTAESKARGRTDLEEAMRTPVIVRPSVKTKSWLAGHVVDWFYYSHHVPYGNMIQNTAYFFEHICNQLRIDPADLGGIPQNRVAAESRIRHLAEGSLASVARRFFELRQQLNKPDDIAAFAYQCPCVFRAPGALVVFVKSESVSVLGASGERIDLK